MEAPAVPPRPSQHTSPTGHPQGAPVSGRAPIGIGAAGSSIVPSGNPPAPSSSSSPTISERISAFFDAVFGSIWRGILSFFEGLFGIFAPSNPYKTENLQKLRDAQTTYEQLDTMRGLLQNGVHSFGEAWHAIPRETRTALSALTMNRSDGGASIKVTWKHMNREERLSSLEQYIQAQEFPSEQLSEYTSMPDPDRAFEKMARLMPEEGDPLTKEQIGNELKVMIKKLEKASRTQLYLHFAEAEGHNSGDLRQMGKESFEANPYDVVKKVGFLQN